MPKAIATRLRFVSGSSPEELEIVINMLPFKVELKSIVKDGSKWLAWFTLSDTVSHDMLNQALRVIEKKKRQFIALKERQNQL